MMRNRTIALLVALIAVVGLLWLFPIVLFPHPGVNDAITLSDLELPVLLVGLVSVVVLALRLGRRRGTIVRAGLGVFLIGVAVDFVLGLTAFGNLSNDRFAALLILPFPIGLAGLLLLLVRLLEAGPQRQDLLAGAVIGLGAAVVAAFWLMLRGARDWLLAPYGFDLVLLVVVLGAAIVLQPLATRTAAR